MLILFDNRLEIGKAAWGYKIFAILSLKFGKFRKTKILFFFELIRNFAKRFSEIDEILPNIAQFTETDRNLAKQILSFGANPAQRV